MNTNQVGWFILQSSNPKFPDAVAYRCTACGIEYLFGMSSSNHVPTVVESGK
jgi:hypothetical protein